MNNFTNEEGESMKKLGIYKNAILTPTKILTKIKFLLAISIFLLLWYGIANWYHYSNSKLFINCSNLKDNCSITRYQYPDIYEKFKFQISDLLSIVKKSSSVIDFCFKDGTCRSIYAGEGGRDGFASWYIDRFNKAIKNEKDFNVLPIRYPNNIIAWFMYYFIFIIAILLFYNFFVSGFLSIIKVNIDERKLIKTKIAFFFNITTEYNLNDLILVNVVKFGENNNKFKKLILRFKDHEERFTLLSDEEKINELINIAKQNLYELQST